MEWLFSAVLRPLYHRERNPLPIVQEVGWASEPVRTGSENLAAEAEENHEYQSSCWQCWDSIQHSLECK